MGIPKFFKWIVERYPCIISPFDNATVASIDNLYLDMNGIIHNCARSDDKTQSRPSEKELMLKIFQYIDMLFSMIKPRKHFFMAIDGVAPRAKMNQQRSRRFRSALESHLARKKLVKRGEPVPDDPFDSNAITPGTEFMARLSQHLQYFVRKKMQEDTSWQRCKVILSGHDVPGEGEHKILWFIRNRKMTEKNYNPNETHCLYGLDADLIMLGLVTHEPHFMLLREEVFAQYMRRPKGNTGSIDPIDPKFQFLHLGILREYLDLEFRSALDKAPGSHPSNFDLERVIDDFVAICFLCGNDFIPGLVMLDIREDAIGLLFDIYKEVVPTLDDYLTKNGSINFERMGIFIARVAEKEKEILQSRSKTLLSKKKVRSSLRKHRRKKRITKIVENKVRSNVYKTHDEPVREGNRQSLVDRVLAEHDQPSNENELKQLLKEQQHLLDEEKGRLTEADAAFASMMTLEECEEDVIIDPNIPFNDEDPIEISINEDEMEDDGKLELLVRALKRDGSGLDFELWSKLYYLRKFGIRTTRNSTEESKKAQIVVSYVEGLKWIYEYYYNGCVSWKWFYPYHYAPICSDLMDLKTIAANIQFALDKPFHPFEQLLGVLPPRSSKLLPAAFRPLLLSNKSPILDFYPDTFEIDREGTRYEYEGTVLLPFIDEDRLRSAIRSIDQSSLTEEERKRNTFSVELLFEHVPPGSSSTTFEPYLFTSTLPGEIPDIIDCNVKVTEFKASDFKPAEMRFLPRLCDGAYVGGRVPEGFPSLFSKNIHSAKLEIVGLTLFGYPSKMPSMCIHVHDQSEYDSDDDYEISSLVQLLRDHERDNNEPLQWQQQDQQDKKTVQSVDDIAHFLGKNVYVGYPFPRLATVSRVSDKETSIYADGRREQHSDEYYFVQEARNHQKVLMQRYAVNIGRVELLMYVKLFNGMKKDHTGAIVRSFTDEEFVFSHQLLAEEYDPIPDPKFIPKRAIPIEVEYPIGTKVIPVSDKVHPDFIGQKCVVLGYTGEGAQTMLRIGIDQQDSTDGLWRHPPLHDIPALVPPEVIAFSSQKFYPFSAAAKKIGVSARDLALVVEEWNVIDHRGKNINIGLNLRNTKTNKCISGYIRRETSKHALDKTYFLNHQNSSSSNRFSVEGQREWELSDMALELICEYQRNFPELFECLAQKGDSTALCSLMSIYGSVAKCQIRLKELRGWLDTQESRKFPFLPCGTQQFPDSLITALEKKFMEYIQNRTLETIQQQQQQRHQRTYVANPADVYKPSDPYPTHYGFSHALGHHVIYLSDCGQVPFGLSGIIVGIEGTNTNVVFPVEFVGGHTLNGRLKTFRGQTVPLESLLDLTVMDVLK